MRLFSRKPKRATALSEPTSTRTRPSAVNLQPDPDDAAGFTSVPWKRLALPTDGRVAVAGESHYQQALALAAHGVTAGDDFDHHLPATAVLVPEPENAWDPNAVRVDVVVEGTRTAKVGYLARAVAGEYQPTLLKLRGEGVVGTCPARITGGGAKYYGIYLHLSYPEDLLTTDETGDPEIAESHDGYAVLRSDWSCTVTKEIDHQDVLRSYSPRPGTDSRQVLAELNFCRIASGKYRGETAIEVRFDNQRVGELTHAMTERYLPVVTRVLNSGLKPTCRSEVVTTKNGLEVELMMPPDTKRSP